MKIQFKKKTIPLGMIFQLRELSEKEVQEADARLAKAPRMSILNSQNDGIFEWFAVLSGEKIYEVTRLGQFVHCTCPGFEFVHGCKHVALTFPKMCVRCGEREVPHRGDSCRNCFFVKAPAKRQAARVY